MENSTVIEPFMNDTQQIVVKQLFLAACILTATFNNPFEEMVDQVLAAVKDDLLEEYKAAQPK